MTMEHFKEAATSGLYRGYTDTSVTTHEYFVYMECRGSRVHEALNLEPQTLNLKPSNLLDTKRVDGVVKAP